MPDLLISQTTSAGVAFGIAAFLAAFACLFALHVYRAQNFAVFAGLVAAESVKLFYLITLLGQMNRRGHGPVLPALNSLPPRF